MVLYLINRRSVSILNLHQSEIGKVDIEPSAIRFST